MDESIYILDMPDFRPVYSQKVLYGYSGKKGEKLKELLLETSNFHCMYCFASLKGDRTDLGEIEHSIEKTLNDHLIECVPNMAVTCKNCNQSLKRTGEKQRKDKILPYIDQYEKELDCQGAQCKAFCDAYGRLRSRYCRLNKLNLQPFGMRGEFSGLEYRIQYDIMKAEFIPSRKYGYDKEDIEILEHHIRQFKLNDTGFRTEALLEFIEDTIEADGKYSKHKNKYSNYIVDLFVKKIQRYTAKEILKICERIYINYQLCHVNRKGRTYFDEKS